MNFLTNKFYKLRFPDLNYIANMSFAFSMSALLAV